MQIDHVCLAVKSIKSTSRRICEVLDYKEKTSPVKNSKQDVNVLFLSRQGSLDIKLIEPASKESPLINFLRTKGEGLHHICFKSDDVNESVSLLKEKGARITSEPIAGEAFNDELIAFAYIAGGLNIEIIDTDERRSLI
jgi:methylmalonyl-CoA/ethylmalonyl-CoA epimerase